MPPRLYQTPDGSAQASSASMVVPSIKCSLSASALTGSKAQTNSAHARLYLQRVNIYVFARLVQISSTTRHVRLRQCPALAQRARTMQLTGRAALWLLRVEAVR